MIVKRLHLLAAACFVLVAPSLATAEVSKDACIESHSKGQDAREQGKLTLARKLFLTCAQSACPALIQGDCARFAEDLTRMQPSLSFTARDGNGADLPDTSVYVDDLLTVTRLDDGKPYDVDPGQHIVKFFHGSKEQSTTIVVLAGEKGRTIAMTFGAGTPAPKPMITMAGTTPPASSSASERREKSTTHHPMGAKVTIVAGLTLAVGGTAAGVLGLLRVPSTCSISTHQCAGPPGDAMFADAASAVRLSNMGWIAAGVGVTALAGGMVWYVKGRKTERATLTAIAPFMTSESAGMAAIGRF